MKILRHQVRRTDQDAYRRAVQAYHEARRGRDVAQIAAAAADVARVGWICIWCGKEGISGARGPLWDSLGRFTRCTARQADVPEQAAPFYAGLVLKKPGVPA